MEDLWLQVAGLWLNLVRDNTCGPERVFNFWDDSKLSLHIYPTSPQAH